jgi:hypothetical protein
MADRSLLVVALAIVGLVAASRMSFDSDPQTSAECRQAEIPDGLGSHPGLFLDAGEVSAIKAKVAERQEPWATSYARMIVDADATLDLEPLTVVDQGHLPRTTDPHDYYTDAPYAGTGDGIINPLNDRADYRSAIAFTRSATSASPTPSRARNAMPARRSISSGPG